MTEPRQIATVRITDDHRAQPRAAIAVEKVQDYIDDMSRGDAFPPLVVFHDGKVYWLADGFHRFYAARGAGVAEIACDVREGALREAILYSCGANAAHGLRRSNDDKRRAVAKLLDDPEWAQWSDNEIARRCAVDGTLVARVRREMAHTSGNRSMEPAERTFTHPKTGEPTTMRTGNIGPVPRKPTPVLQIDPAQLVRSLHEIDRHIEMMGDPLQAVLHFPADQHYLHPLSRLEEMGHWMTAFAAAWRASMEAKVHERLRS